MYPPVHFPSLDPYPLRSPCLSLISEGPAPRSHQGSGRLFCVCPSPPPSTFCPRPRLPQPHPPWSPPYLTSHSISVCSPEQAWPCFLPHCTSPLARAPHRDTHTSKVPASAHGGPPVLLPQTSCWFPCLGLPLIWLHKHIFPSTTLVCPVIPWSSAFGSSLLRKSGFETFHPAPGLLAALPFGASL